MSLEPGALTKVTVVNLVHPSNALELIVRLAVELLKLAVVNPVLVHPANADVPIVVKAAGKLLNDGRLVHL